MLDKMCLKLISFVYGINNLSILRYNKITNHEKLLTFNIDFKDFKNFYCNFRYCLNRQN